MNVHRRSWFTNVGEEENSPPKIPLPVGVCGGSFLETYTEGKQLGRFNLQFVHIVAIKIIHYG